MKNVRVYFSKKDQAKYISHLDLMRCMMRCIKRTDIPVWYTEGFNPRMYITFAMPLSLGYEGERESFDIKITDDGFSIDKIVSELQKVMPKGLAIIDASEEFLAASEIGFALYDIEIVADRDIGNLFEEFLLDEKILVEKRSKKKVKQIDIKPFLDVKSVEIDGNTCKAKIVLPAGIEGNVNPGLIRDAFGEFSGMELEPIKVKRNEIFDKNMKKFN